jgi:hypothetical protein
MMDAGKLRDGLAQFTGTETWTRHGMFRQLLMTEGVTWLCENAQCYWLVDAIAAKVSKEQPMLQGVLLHQKDANVGRVVSCDGFRTFIGSFPAPKAPAWLKAGVLIARADLKARVSMIAKVGGSTLVEVSYAAGDSTLTLRDQMHTMEFRVLCGAVDAFPDYEAAIQLESFTDMDAEGDQAKRSEWEPVGFKSQHMKECGDIAKVLEAGLAKEEREKDSMTIRVFQGSDDAPRWFDFMGWPGSLLVLGATRTSTQLPVLTSKVLAPALQGTLRALRAHASRWTDAAAAAKTAEQRNACLAKAESFQARVAAILERSADKAALAGPTPAAAALAGPPDAKPEVLTAAEKAAATRRKRAEARAATVH